MTRCFFALSFTLKKVWTFFRDIKWVYDISSPQNEVISLRSDDRKETAVLIPYFSYKIFIIKFLIVLTTLFAYYRFLIDIFPLTFLLFRFYRKKKKIETFLTRYATLKTKSALFSYF